MLMRWVLANNKMMKGSMARYIVTKNPQENGNHIVHNLGTWCPDLPNSVDQKSLGNFPTCQAAMREAKKHFQQVNGCFKCSRACFVG
tara:strand:- start:1909 stop:2169 length:261 start_codon:yes stop_codon:yes gene_type:complete